VADDTSGSPTFGDIYDTSSSAYVAGCRASWFIATVSTQPPTTLAGGATASGVVTLTMPADTTDNQAPCEGKTPQFTVTVS